MPLRPILIYGNPLLHEKAAPVEKITGDIQELIDDMFETMFHARGIGLAATQLGILKSIIVIDLPREDDQEEKGRMLVLINLEILDRQGSCSFEEGCLSIPGVNGDVDRPEAITIRFLDRDGNLVEMECDEMLARVIQHEYDHLQGILFVQHLKPAVRKKLNPQLRSLQKVF